jgi:hypothetical protein
MLVEEFECRLQDAQLRGTRGHGVSYTKLGGF